MFKTLLTYLGMRSAKKRGFSTTQSGLLAAAPLILSGAAFAWHNRERIRSAIQGIRTKRLALADSSTK